MTEPVRILIVEDTLADVELARREINQVVDSCLFQQVETRLDFLTALENFQPDLIISAYRLARFDGLTVLKLTQERAPLTPVIIWIDSLNEDIAVKCMQAGATGYIIKEYRKCLGAAVNCALEKKQLHQERQRAMEVLRESEERYRLFFDNSIDANLLTAPDGPILAANPAACQMFGWTAEEMKRLGRDDLVDTTDPRLSLALAERARTGYFKGELTLIRRDGTKFPAEIFSAMFKDKDGQTRTSMIIRDITERKWAEEQRQAAERFAQATIDALAEHLCVLDEAGTILAVNRAWRDFAEANPPIPVNYAVGVNYLTVCDQASGPNAVEAAPFAAGIRAVMRGEVAEFSLEYPCPSPEDERWFIGRVTPFSLAGSRRLVVSHYDITGRKQVEKELQESEARYRLISENTSDVIWLFDLAANRFTYVSPSVYHLLGFSSAEVMEKSPANLVTPTSWQLITDQLPRRITALEAGDESRRSQIYEVEHIHRDGHLVPTEITITLVPNEAGRVIHIIGITRDITERQRAEQTLRESEEKYRTLFETMAQGVVYQTIDGRISAANPAAERILGVPLAQLRERTSIDPRWRAIHEDGADFPGETHPAMVALQTGVEVKNTVMGVFNPVAGQYRWININAMPQFRPGEKRPYQVYTTFDDITDRKRVEEALREKHAHTRSLLRLSRNLEQAQTFDEALKAARDEVRHSLGYQYLWVYLFTEDRKYAQILGAGGQSLKEMVKQAGVSTLTIQGDRMLEETAAAREIVVVEDARRDERTNKEIVAQLGNRTIVNVPIIFLERHLGAVGTGTFGDEGVRVPTKSEQEYLEAMASHMAVVLDRIHLLNERREQAAALQHYTDRLQGLHEIERAILTAQSPADIGQAALSRLRQQIPCWGAGITLFDLARNEFVIFVSNTDSESAIRQGMRFPIAPDWLAPLETGQVGVVNDALALTDPPQFVQLLLAEGVQAYLNAPLIAHGTLIGALNLAADRPGVFTAAEVEIVREVAAALAVALQHARLLEAEQKARRQLRSLTHQLVTAQEEERQRLSRELHDEAGQALTGLKMSLELLQADLPAELDSFRSRLEQIISLADTTMEQIRLLAQALRPPALDTVGLHPTLASLCRSFAQNTNLPVDYSGTNLPRLPEAINITLYRVLQESLTNIARHSQASRVEVSLRDEDAAISLMVIDDGRGFQPSAGPTERLGIIGMRERLSLLGGQLVIESEPGQGTRLMARIPYQEERL